VHPLLVPGGSSSGSAVAVATGAVAFSLGTDTAGSGRVPAAMCGIVGLKPRPGVLGSEGVIPAVASLDCVSVFASSVSDADAVLTVLDGRGWAGIAPGGLRVAVPGDRSLACLDDAARAAWQDTVAALATTGVTVHEVDLDPFFAAGDLLYGGPWVAERDVAVGGFVDDHPDDVEPVVRDTILASRSWSAADAFRARDRLADLAATCATTWSRADVLAVPTVARAVTLDEARRDPVGVNAELGRYTNFVNLLGLAALAVPVAPSVDGRPTGITLLAPAGMEPALPTVA
jgi:allophanate hydrolase